MSAALIGTASDAARFWAKVSFTGVCWEWQASQNGKSGYGYFSHGGRNILAHRWAYQSLVGPITEGLELDHLCRNRLCVNPDHLDPVTASENVRRGSAPRIAAARALTRTHCMNGHELTPENTYLHGRKRRRRCVTCRAAQRARVKPTYRTCEPCGKTVRVNNGGFAKHLRSAKHHTITTALKEADDD